MVGCNRLLRIICLGLGSYLLVINVILWATDPEVNMLLLKQYNITEEIYLIDKFQIMHNYNMTHYRGFKWFFDNLSNFPGPSFTHGMLMTYANIISGYSITGNWGLDFLLAIFRILSTPLLLTITITMDILNNAIWFIGFIVKA